jgi:DNA-binding response OmpR family regulator
LVVASILVIDDNQSICDMLRDILELEGHVVTEAADGADGMMKFRQQGFDLVITDIIMPDKEGIETIMEIRGLNGDVGIIAISGGGRIKAEDVLKTARGLGADEVVPKPFGAAEMRRLVRSLLTKRGSGQS